MELEWEEWDGTGSYVHHCVAGSPLLEWRSMFFVSLSIPLKHKCKPFCADCPKSKLAARQAECWIQRNS